MTAKRLLVATLASGLALVGVAAAFQQPAMAPAGQQGVGVFTPYAQTPGTNVWYGSSSHNEAYKLAQQYMKAEKEEDRRELRRKLNELLSQEFDQQAKRQQKELEELQAQIDQLRSIMQKRRDAKSGIIERRIEQLVQEAQGLGWNTPPTPRPNLYMGGFGSAPSGYAPPPVAPPARSGQGSTAP
jgi:Spy/CpxP family protein refolding chaperone